MNTKTQIHCSLQTQDFDLAEEYQLLRSRHPSAGAIVTFSGLVRDFCKQGKNVSEIELSTYNALALKQIEDLAERAINRFDIHGITIIHRYGRLAPSEQIVFVGVTSAHRAESFAAAEMLMDYLKSTVAFWKREHLLSDNDNTNLTQWVNVLPDDLKALERWS